MARHTADRPFADTAPFLALMPYRSTTRHSIYEMSDVYGTKYLSNRLGKVAASELRPTHERFPDILLVRKFTQDVGLYPANRSPELITPISMGGLRRQLTEASNPPISLFVEIPKHVAPLTPPLLEARSLDSEPLDDIISDVQALSSLHLPPHTAGAMYPLRLRPHTRAISGLLLIAPACQGSQWEWNIHEIISFTQQKQNEAHHDIGVEHRHSEKR